MLPRILMGLIGQSEKRYMFLREAAMKMEAGFGDLDLVFEREFDPGSREGKENLDAFGFFGKQDLENRMKYELALQSELKRFMMGLPPNIVMRRPAYQGQPQQLPPGAQNAQQAPQQQVYGGGQAGPPGAERQGQQQAAQQMPAAMMPEIPVGQLDLRDPKQAAAALLRAQPMPLGPAPMTNQPQQGGAYVPPAAYGVPQQQIPYGVPQNAYVPPTSQAPVVQAQPDTATAVMQQGVAQQPVSQSGPPASSSQQVNGTAKNTSPNTTS